MDKLNDILERQKSLLIKSVDHTNLSEAERQDWVLENVQHAIDELVELRKQLPRRYAINRKHDLPARTSKALVNYVKVILLLANIGIIFDWSANDIYEAYIQENTRQHELH